MVANAGALVLSRLGVAALGWAGTLLIVRRLTVEQFGRFSFVFSFLGLVAVLSELGIGRASIRGLLDERRDSARFGGTMVVLRGVLGVLSYGLAVGFTVLAGYPSEVVTAMAVAGAAMVLATPSHAIEAVYQARLALRWVAIGNVVGQLTQLAAIVALAVGGGSVVLFVIPAVLCEIVILLWRLSRVGRLQRLTLNVDWPAWKEMLREAAPLAAGAVLATAYFRVDSVMLSKLDSFEAVGIYGVAYKFVDLVQALPTALMVPVLSLMVASWPLDMDAFRETFRRAFALLALLGVIIAVEFAVFAEPVISLLYGSRYAVGAGAARLVVAAACLSAVGSLAFTTLVAIGRNRLYPLVTLLGLAVNVALNFWLIPLRSYEGAALATIITEILVVGLLAGAAVRLGVLAPPQVRQAGLALLAGAGAAVVAVGSRSVLPWPAAATVSGGSYLLLLHLLGAAGTGGLRGLIR